MQRLHRSIFQRRNPERPCLAVLLRNVDAPEGQRPITARSDRPNGFHLGPRGGPEFLVHSRGSSAFVFRYPPNVNSLAGKRARQEPLQCFHPAPVLLLNRLRDTTLQPPYGSIYSGPVDAVPRKCCRGVRRCTGHTHVRSPAKALATLLAIRDPAEVGALSCEVMLQPLSDRLQIGIRLLCHPIPALPIVRLTADLPIWRK